MRYLIALLLLPSLLMAGGVQIITPRTRPLPVSAAMAHDSLQGPNFDLFTTESGATKATVFTQNVRWDSAGTWVRPDFSGTLIEDDYYEIKVRGWTLHYARSGAFRWYNKGGFYESTPLNFDTLSVEITVDLGIHGFEQIFRLDENSPDSLIFRQSFDTGLTNNGQGKGQIKKLEKLVAELGEVRAWDSEGTILPVVVRTTDSTRTIIVDKTNAVGYVWIDPTVNDTARVSYSTGFVRFTGSSFTDARNAIVGDDNDGNLDISGSRAGISNIGIRVHRTFLTFALDRLPEAISITSAKIHLSFSVASGSPTIHVTKGTFSGSVSNDWYIEFQGYSAVDSGAWNIDSYGSVEIVDDATELTFNAVGDSAVLALMGGTDSMRVVLLEGQDVAGSYTTDRATGTIGLLYLIIDYSLGFPPGMTTTIQDSVLYLRPLYGVIDSIGGIDLSARGFEYYKWDDNSDTTTLTESGTFSEPQEFALMTDSLPAHGPGDSLTYRAWGTNAQGTTKGEWVTIPALLGVGISLIVDGRTVNTAK